MIVLCSKANCKESIDFSRYYTKPSRKIKYFDRRNNDEINTSY